MVQTERSERVPEEDIYNVDAWIPQCYMPVLTKPVTLSSISLSVNPISHSQLHCQQPIPKAGLTAQGLLLLLSIFYHPSVSPSPASDPRCYAPYLANTLGSTPRASRSMIGTCGLFFFIVGYARVRNDLLSISEPGSYVFVEGGRAHRTAALGSED